MDGVQTENGWFAFTSIYHANISSRRVKKSVHHHRTAQYIRFSSSVSCSIFFMFMYSNPIVVHRIFYLCKILQDLLPKPLLLTILLTSQAIELESTSKTVSFNALTSTSLDCMVAFSLVVVLTCQQQYFWRWMATMKDEICLLFWIIHPTRKLRVLYYPKEREKIWLLISFGSSQIQNFGLSYRS